jgi:hypothetical protein
METYSEDYSDQRGGKKATVRDFMTSIKDQGYLDNTRADIEGAKITIDGKTATAAPVRIIGEYRDANELKINWTLKKDKDKVWRFVNSRME